MAAKIWTRAGELIARKIRLSFSSELSFFVFIKLNILYVVFGFLNVIFVPIILDFYPGNLSLFHGNQSLL